jgi:hypothetical protein
MGWLHEIMEGGAKAPLFADLAGSLRRTVGE